MARGGSQLMVLTAPKPEDLLTAALGYQARAWSIIPTVGKEARAPWKRFQSCPASPAELQSLFALQGVDGLAVILGSVSGGLACRDFDDPDLYKQWAESHPDLAVILPTVRTHRGAHVYCHAPKERYFDFGPPKGEYRGDSRHYCLLPPSIHGKGSPYVWSVPLPTGPLTKIEPVAAGLVCNTEDTEHSEDTDNPDNTPLTTRPALSVSSALSVLHAPSIEELILRTLPTGPGMRAHRLFDLARALKAVPHLADADFDALRPIIQRWHKLARPAISTQEFEESWIDFLRAWDRVRFPAGTGPLDQAFGIAKSQPLPACAERFSTGGIRMLIALCQQLQLAARDDTFFLACRSAAKLLDIDYTTANRWLWLLEKERILERISTGSKASKKANEYFFLISTEERGKNAKNC
jgi:hypothetical protein